MKKYKLPTGFLFVDNYTKGELETLSIGDYGKARNIKADFLGHTRELHGVENGNIMPLQEKWVITLSTQYGCAMKCRFCLIPYSPILMSDYTTKPIQDIEIGDTVIANMDLKENKNRSNLYASKSTKTAKVTGLHKRVYDGDIYVITTESGNTISCTKEHPIASEYKTRIKFKDASELLIGDNILTSRDISPDNHIDNDWRFGWLMGFIMGDGVFDVNDNIGRCMVAQNDITLLELAKEICTDLDVKTSNIWKNGERNHRFAIQGKALEKLLNISNVTNMYKTGYIAGYWDAEGFSLSHNNQYRVCDSVKDNLIIVENYLQSFGIESNISIQPRDNNKDMYVLTAKLNRDKFNAIFMPLHEKRMYLDDNISQSFSFFEKIVNIDVYGYNGLVYNIETSEHTYFTNGILSHNCDVPQVKFKGNVSFEDLKKQFYSALSMYPDIKYTDRLNIHFARMGDPIFNEDVLGFTEWLMYNKLDIQNETGVRVEVIHPVFTTMCPKYKHTRKMLYDFIWLKNHLYNGQAGLQLSINSTSNSQRDYMFDNMNMTLGQIAEMVKDFETPIGRKYCLNFAYASDNEVSGQYLAKLFDPDKWMVKITPIHNNNACMENGIETVEGYNSYQPYKFAEESFKDAGFDTLVFIPSMDEEKGLITCGNAVLGGSKFGLEVK